MDGIQSYTQPEWKTFDQILLLHLIHHTTVELNVQICALAISVVFPGATWCTASISDRQTTCCKLEAIESFVDVCTPFIVRVIHLLMAKTIM